MAEPKPTVVEPSAVEAERLDPKKQPSAVEAERLDPKKQPSAVEAERLDPKKQPSAVEAERLGPDKEPPPRRISAARRRVLAELAIVYGVVAVLTVAITLLRYTAAAEYVSVLVAVLFLGVALRMADRDGRARAGTNLVGPRGPARFGMDLAGVLSPGDREAYFGFRGLLAALRNALRPATREVLVALFLALLIFPPFVIGFQAFHRPDRPFVLTFPEDAGMYLLGQLLLVGLPEEALFRGYVQTRLTDAFPKTRRIFGVDVSIPALVGASFLFAVIHFVVDLNPLRMAVFFPGLVFGWLRAGRGGIGAAIVFHALSNFLSATLIRSWL
ncbi:MAG: MrtC family glutamic-type intramembrane protease [Myxococcota bacterium]